MADVFVSYKREDRAIAERAAAWIRRNGLSAFFDVNIPVGDTWDQVIETELRQAKAVLVLWTPRSAASRWVRLEARDALTRGILCPVVVEECNLPLEFQDIQSAQISSFDTPSQELERLFESVSHCVGHQSKGAQSSILATVEAPSEYQHYCDLIRSAVEVCDFISFLSAQSDAESVQQMHKAFSRLKIDIGQIESVERRVYERHELSLDVQNGKFLIWSAEKRSNPWPIFDQIRRAYLKRDIDEAAYSFSRRYGIIRIDLVDNTADPDEPSTRRPEWFNGSKLSEQGVAEIYRLYDEGRSVYAAAKHMGISYSAASHRYEMWKNRQQK